MNHSTNLRVQRPVVTSLITLLIAGLFAFGNFYQFAVVGIFKEVGTSAEHEPPSWEQQSPTTYSIFSLVSALVFSICFVIAILALMKSDREKSKNTLIITLLFVIMQGLIGILMS
ncbi:MAG TPA: hypothetical protein VMR70_10240 [Flavisolibacter sp.]|nr:hypothetical protein [Flavisolibacter sp.]